MIPFANIPSNLRVPLFYAEIDPSHANTAADPQRTLLIGQAAAGATATLRQPVRCTSAAQARQLAGVGSILADMAIRYLANDPSGELWLLPIGGVGAGSGGVALVRSLAFSGAINAAGTLALYVDDVAVPVSVTAGMTLTQLATAVAAAINANADLTVKAAVDGANPAQVDVTAKGTGPLPTAQINVNFKGAAAGEITPAGLGFAVATVTAGAGTPDITTALASLGDMGFDFIVTSFNDTANLAATTAMMSDVSGRWSWGQQRFGHVFTAMSGSSGSLAAVGATFNDQHLTIVPVPAGMPSPTWAVAAAVAGVAAQSLRADPGVPLQYLAVSGLLAPALANRFTEVTRNLLLFDGISSISFSTAGQVSIENLITTYQQNAAGAPDNSYLQVETMFTLAYVLRFMRRVVQAKYARVKLAADGTRLVAGNNVVTPSIIKADLIAAYRELEEAGMVQQSDVFAANLVVQKDAANPNRVNVLWPAILIDQLRVFALLCQFRLS